MPLCCRCHRGWPFFFVFTSPFDGSRRMLWRPSAHSHHRMPTRSPLAFSMFLMCRHAPRLARALERKLTGRQRTKWTISVAGSYCSLAGNRTKHPPSSPPTSMIQHLDSCVPKAFPHSAPAAITKESSQNSNGHPDQGRIQWPSPAVVFQCCCALAARAQH